MAEVEEVCCCSQTGVGTANDEDSEWRSVVTIGAEDMIVGRHDEGLC